MRRRLGAWSGGRGRTREPSTPRAAGPGANCSAATHSSTRCIASNIVEGVGEMAEPEANEASGTMSASRARVWWRPTPSSGRAGRALRLVRAALVCAVVAAAGAGAETGRTKSATCTAGRVIIIGRLGNGESMTAGGIECPGREPSKPSKPSCRADGLAPAGRYRTSRCAAGAEGAFDCRATGAATEEWVDGAVRLGRQSCAEAARRWGESMRSNSSLSPVASKCTPGWASFAAITAVRVAWIRFAFPPTASFRNRPVRLMKMIWYK